jgi:hypothetical protein
MKIKRAAVAAVAGFVLMMVSVSPASAGKPDTERDHVVFVDEDQDVCGVNVDVVVDVRFVDREFLDKNGDFVRFMETSSGSNTFVNDAGESVTVSFANVIRVSTVVDEAAGIATETLSVRGLASKFTTSHGRPLSQDVGLITFVNVFDLATEQLISSEIATVSGPHPEAEGGFTLFCEIITAELG